MKKKINLLGLLLFLAFVNLHAQCGVVGTVFPFVHSSSVPALNTLHEVTVTLHNVPPSTSRDPLGDVIYSIPRHKTIAVYYDESVYIPNTPENPGTQGFCTNPGSPIDWTALGKSCSPLSSPSVLPGNKPTPPVGWYSFGSVAPGEYILQLSRAGFVPRFVKITVPAGGNLFVGHKEIIGGDVNGDLLIDGSDITEINGSFSPNIYDIKYKPQYDINGNGVVDGTDTSLVNFSLGFNPEVYEDTKDWLDTY